MIAIFRALTFILLIGLGLLPAAQAAEKVTAEEVEAMSDRLQQDIRSLRKLDELIEGASEHDLESLVYRRDDRSFKLLVDLDKMVEAASALPEDEEVRSDVAVFLGDGLGGAGKGVLQRIVELTQRIAQQHHGRLQRMHQAEEV